MYVATVSEVKRVVLRLLEQPVRGMGMHSPELLALLEDCPKGAETLVTRIIHLLTDKGNFLFPFTYSLYTVHYISVNHVRNQFKLP